MLLCQLDPSGHLKQLQTQDEEHRHHGHVVSQARDIRVGEEGQQRGPWW